MSAFLAVKYEDRVEFLSDGAVYHDDGTVEYTRQKVWTSKRLPMAFVSVGGDLAMTGLGMALELMTLFKTFDEALLRFGEILEKLGSDERELAAVGGVIAGISETLGPVMYGFHTYRGEGENATFNGLEPFRLYDVGSEFFGGPVPVPRAFKESGLPCYWACDGLAEFGADYFELLRRTKMEHVTHPDKPMLYAVGGHVDHTVVSADGCTVTRIKEWPQDVPGQEIEPFGLAEAA